MKPALLATLLSLLAPLPAVAQTAPPELFNQSLPNVPGHRLVVHRLVLGDAPIPPHRHAGSIFVHVLEGAATFSIDHGPEQIVRAGESFFEPAGALHSMARSAQPGVPVVLLTVMVIADGAPQLTFDPPLGPVR